MQANKQTNRDGQTCTGTDTDTDTDTDTGTDTKQARAHTRSDSRVEELGVCIRFGKDEA